MLKRLLGGKFTESTGCYNDLEFWSRSSSGVNSNNYVDHMVDVLSSLGYAGTPRDMLRSWLADTAGNIGSMYDNANKIFSAPVSSPVAAGDTLLLETGSRILLETGDNIILE